MDKISSGILVGSIIGQTGSVYIGPDSKAKKKAADNKKVEKKEGGLI